MAFNANTHVIFLYVLLFLTVLLSCAHEQQQQQPPLQQRAPHGLAFESPEALSPSAFEFFHPNHQPNGEAANAPLPVSMARADRVVESEWAATERGGFGGGGAGGVVATVIGVACVVLVAVGISYYYLVIQRKSERAKSIIKFQPYV